MYAAMPVCHLIACLLFGTILNVVGHACLDGCQFVPLPILTRVTTTLLGQTSYANDKFSLRPSLRCPMSHFARP